MKSSGVRIWMAGAAILLSTGISSASTVNCDIGAVNSVSFGSSSSPEFMCGELMFSNFQVTSANGGAIGRVDINSASYDDDSGIVSLAMNPNLQRAQDEWLMYEVSAGGVAELDLGLGGKDATVSELACTAPIPTAGPGAYLCPAGTQLGHVADYSNDPNAPVFSNMWGETEPVYVFKDLETGGALDAQLSNVTQSLHEAPEPISLLLLGSGLFGLGILKRRRA